MMKCTVKNSSSTRSWNSGYLRCLICLLILMTILAVQVPPRAEAASDWDSALEDIHSLYSDYIGLQKTIKAENLRIQTLRKQNNSDLSAINSRLKATDADLLSRLKAEAEAAQKKHAPLLEQYSLLGKQATAARKANNLKSATILEIKRNKLKTAATAARAEVKSKTTALSEARALTAAKTKSAKDALAPIIVLKKQITAESKEVSTLQTVRSAADKRYKAAVKLGDAVTAAAEMKISYATMIDIRSKGQQIYTWEQKITAVLRSAEAMLPK